MLNRTVAQMIYVESIKPHLHYDELEIILVLKGKITLYKMERKVELKEGDIAFVNRKVSHYIKSEGAYILSILVKLSEFKHIYDKMEYVEFLAIDEMIQYNRPLKQKLDTCTIDYLVFIFQHQNNQRFRSELFFYEDQLMHTLFATYQLRININEKEEYLDNELLNRYYRVVQYVSDHINEKIVVDDILKEVYMNPTYFSQFMKKTSVVGFKEFVTYRKLIAVMGYIIDSDYSMSEIALLVGMTDMKTFYTLFKRYFLQSPAKYRKHLLEIEDNYDVGNMENICFSKVLNTFIEKYHINKHTINTTGKLYKYVVLCQANHISLKDVDISLNPYHDLNNNLSDYQPYKYFTQLVNIIKENKICFSLVFPYEIIKRKEEKQLMMNFLRGTISGSGANEVKRWKTIIRVNNMNDIKEAMLLKEYIDKEIGSFRVEVMLGEYA